MKAKIKYFTPSLRNQSGMSAIRWIGEQELETKISLYRLRFTVVKYSANELTQSVDFTEASDRLKKEYEHSRGGKRSKTVVLLLLHDWIFWIGLPAVDTPVLMDPNAIVKAFGLDTFCVQLSLAYRAVNCDSSTIKTYDDVKPWTSSKFYERENCLLQ